MCRDLSSPVSASPQAGKPWVTRFLPSFTTDLAPVGKTVGASGYMDTETEKWKDSVSTSVPCPRLPRALAEVQWLLTSLQDFGKELKTPFLIRPT